MCTILLIDNSLQLEQQIRALLEQSGMDAAVVTAEDGKAAMRFLKEGNKADIIFSDIDQPSSGGIDLYKKMVPAYPNIKRVVVTSSQCFEMAKYVINLQLNGYLTKPVDPEEVGTLLQQLLPEVFTAAGITESVGRTERDELSKHRIVNEALAIIERDVERDIGLDYIAQKVHLSSCYLSALFREVTGQGLICYITNYRMNLAVSLLLDTNLRIFEIAQHTGYRSTPYFCTVFKNKYDMTPSEFRERNHGKSSEEILTENNVNI